MYYLVSAVSKLPNEVRSLLFRDVTRRRFVVSNRRTGTTYRSHLQGSSSSTAAYLVDTQRQFSVLLSPKWTVKNPLVSRFRHHHDSSYLEQNPSCKGDSLR